VAVELDAVDGVSVNAGEAVPVRVLVVLELLVVVVPVADVAWLLVAAEFDTVDGGGVDADGAVEVPVPLLVVLELLLGVVPLLVVAVPVLLGVPPESDESDESDAPDESAEATPGEVTTITPIPKAAAKAPIRPM